MMSSLYKKVFKSSVFVTTKKLSHIFKRNFYSQFHFIEKNLHTLGRAYEIHLWVKTFLNITFQLLFVALPKAENCCEGIVLP